eukprot:731441-Prorocentrum_lima.AAC.1
MVGGGPFSALQHLMPKSAAYCEKLDKGIAYIVFCTQVYKEKWRQDRMFLHEHPRAAGSWQLAEVQEVAQLDGVG